MRIAECQPWTFGPDWNDVGNALRRWLNSSDLLETYVLAVKRERNAALIAKATTALDALGDDVRAEVLARYSHATTDATPNAPTPRVIEPPALAAPVQGDLFGSFQTITNTAA